MRREEREHRLAQLGGPMVASESMMELNGGGGVEPIALVDVGAKVIQFEAPTRLSGLLGAWWWQLAAKRALDVVGSVALLLVLTPVLVAVAVAVGLTSPGPILYRQRRVGRDGAPFTMLKFRSMVRNAHNDRDLHHADNEMSGPVFKIREDPRVTRVGRAIRRMSLDELPQLLNVLVGSMSLVGPRPALPEECAHYSEREMGRLAVKPGITCLWQVSGRSDVDFETWVEMDLEYIRTWSLRADIKLLLKTIPAVVSGKGAY
jgi:exopolysaccharide biosynthesis polyprenyl glycosylphosphotransferase